METKAAQEPSKNEAGFQDRFLVDFCRLLHNWGSILGGKIEAKATKSPSKIEAVLGRRKKWFSKNSYGPFRGGLVGFASRGEDSEMGGRTWQEDLSKKSEQGARN